VAYQVVSTARGAEVVVNTARHGHLEVLEVAFG